MSILVNLSTVGTRLSSFLSRMGNRKSLVPQQKFLICQLNSEYLNSVHGLYELPGYLSRNLDDHLENCRGRATKLFLLLSIMEGSARIKEIFNFFYLSLKMQTPILPLRIKYSGPHSRDHWENQLATPPIPKVMCCRNTE